MSFKKIDPQPKITTLFKAWVEREYGKKPFPQFEAAERFFQWYFKRDDLFLNDFKNMGDWIKRASADGEFTWDGKRNGRNHYIKN